LIHNTAFKQENLNWVYHAIEVMEEEASECIVAVREKNIRGLSVTMPLKEAVIPHLDGLTETAKELSAINCVFWHGDNLIGDNTDGDGFVNALKSQLNKSLNDKTFAIIGAGGAARSVAYSLGKNSAKQIIVVNRSKQKAEAAVQLGGSNARVGSYEDVAACDIVVNSTPLGMARTPTEALLPVPVEFLSANQTVIDLVYNPIETEFLRQAKSLGATTFSGLGMLIHQALLQFRLWTGLKTPIEGIENVVFNAVSG
ncbi:MAG: shikimate dehydrogenase, partial [Actinomycetota bacterium]|nr:shikimate dehydrogenase [Actinomycetota bacterium]